MAFRDLIKYGVNTNQGNLSLGGAAERGFLEGEQRVKDMEEQAYLESERTRVADEREQQELDTYYGELYVPPTGSASYDAGVEMMGREWKAEYAALNAAKKAGQIDNDTYVQQKHAIRNRATELKAGQDALNQSYQLYEKALAEGQVSGSTPARIKLLFQSLKDGTAQIQNVDGQPTLVGQTADGEEININMAALGSGNANLRFNAKVDINSTVDQIAKTLEGYKTTIATENGLSLGNVGWEQIQERAAQDITQVLDNASTVQAIAADELGYNSTQIEAIGAEELENRVGDFLLDKVQREYFPVQKIDKFTGTTQYQDATLDLQQQRLNQGLNSQGQPNASLQKLQLDQQQRQNISNAIRTANPTTGGLTALNGVGGYQVEFNEPFIGSNSYTIIDPKGNKQKLSPAQAQVFLQNTLVGAPGATPSQGASTDESNPLGI